MIINHKYKFIFIKTKKTAGTSIEIALSRFCDEGDVITPISAKDELQRQELALRGPQHYRVPLRFYKRLDWLRPLSHRQPKQFFNHAPARYVRENVAEEIWNSYFKFCFDRNPFDKAISLYYYRTREPRPTPTAYLNTVPVADLSNWDIYTINDDIAVDFVGRYEQLADDLAFVVDRLGLPGELSLPRAKGGIRASREHYSNVLDAQARARIELVCAKEMSALAYRWEEASGSEQDVDPDRKED